MSEAEPTESYGFAAIVARSDLPLTAMTVTDPFGGAISPYIVFATLSAERPVLVGSVHARPYEVKESLTSDQVGQLARKSVGSVWYSDVMVEVINDKLKTASSFIVGGDWNEARDWDVVRGYAAGGAEFFKRATLHKWMDAMRKAHAEERPTCFVGRHKYETDHIFCDADLYQGMAPPLIDDSDDVRRMSDHAIVLTSFAI